MQIGIIGYGSFGCLLTELITPHASVVIYSRRQLEAKKLPANASLGSLKDVASCDLIILATELAGLDAICQQLAPLVKPETIVMDVCSVKVMPVSIMKQRLGTSCRLLATHPLFGPYGIKTKGLRGQTLVWHEISGGPFSELKMFLQDGLGLRVVTMTPEAHDQEMAWVHGLTFFVGRGLLDMAPPELTLATGYYEKLRDLVELEKSHSYELFRTIEVGNPYAREVREKYIESLRTIESKLEKEIV